MDPFVAEISQMYSGHNAWKPRGKLTLSLIVACAIICNPILGCYALLQIIRSRRLLQQRKPLKAMLEEKLAVTMSAIAVLNTLIIIIAICLGLFFFSILLSSLKPQSRLQTVQTNSDEATQFLPHQPYHLQLQSSANEESDVPLYITNLRQELLAQHSNREKSADPKIRK